jgi:predicted transcriptional regulator
MPNKELQALLDRVPTWPQELQEDVLALLQFYERELHDPYELTDEDKAAVERGLADAEAGRFATDQEMEELFARYRRS